MILAITTTASWCLKHFIVHCSHTSFLSLHHHLISPHYFCVHFLRILALHFSAIFCLLEHLINCRNHNFIQFNKHKPIICNDQTLLHKFNRSWFSIHFSLFHWCGQPGVRTSRHERPHDFVWRGLLHCQLAWERSLSGFRQWNNNRRSPRNIELHRVTSRKFMLLTSK